MVMVKATLLDSGKARERGETSLGTGWADSPVCNGQELFGSDTSFVPFPPNLTGISLAGEFAAGQAEPGSALG